MQYYIILALVIRVAIALATHTFFQPDEYFQSLEPAHFHVFGYGDLTWEWTSKPPIRSIVYPALNIPIYWLLKIFRLDETFLLVRCSQTFCSGSHNLIYSPDEGCCAESFTWIVGCWDRYMGLGAFTEDAWPELCTCHGEWSTYSLPYLTRDVRQFFLSLTSFFHALSLSRSMSNSLETTLTTIALSYYPWDSSVLPSRYAG